MRKLFTMQFAIGVLVGLLCVNAYAGNALSIVGVSDPLADKIILAVFGLNAILSAVRDILKKFDGVGPGDQIPADKGSLTIVNKVCLFLGKALDYLQGNTQH